MELFISVSGSITNLKVKENLFTRMEIFTKESGKTVKQVVSVYTIEILAENMKVIGKMTSQMDKDFSNGGMEIYTEDYLQMERKMEKDCIFGTIILNLKGIGQMVK
jgi:hypothetical protein